MRILFKIFLFPGVIISWIEYMFPNRGNVWASGRRVYSLPIHILYSLGAWLIIALLLMHKFAPAREAEIRELLKNPSVADAKVDVATETRQTNHLAQAEEEPQDTVQLLNSPDWPAIHDVVARAYGLENTRQVLQWNNPVNGHGGNVFQSGIGQDENGCRQFRITQDNNKTLHIEYCLDGSIH